MIQAGDEMPTGTLMTFGDAGPVEISTEAIFSGQKVVLFAVPGAFTPTCSAKHLPGFLTLAQSLRAKGVSRIACLAVNDIFVLRAWAKENDVGEDVTMLADGSATFTKALGLDNDLTLRGMGIRAKRFGLIATNGTVQYVAVEKPGEFEVSSAEALLAQL